MLCFMHKCGLKFLYALQDNNISQLMINLLANSSRIPTIIFMLIFPCFALKLVVFFLKNIWKSLLCTLAQIFYPIRTIKAIYDKKNIYYRNITQTRSQSAHTRAPRTRICIIRKTFYIAGPCGILLPCTKGRIN